MSISIAIDGPAGAGKSTISRKVSAALGYIYVDTGALYRSIALTLNQQKIAPEETQKIESALHNTDIRLEFIDGEQHVFLNDRDVSGEIRTAEVSMLASKYSARPEVRAYLLSLQRKIAAEHNVIMDGRDIGTVVLPNATLKIFLTADAEDRAQRRYEEMLQRGQSADYETVLADIKKRDYDDSHRAIAPLKPAEDAILVNTTGNTLEQSVKQLSDVILQNLNKGE